MPAEIHVLRTGKSFSYQLLNAEYGCGQPLELQKQGMIRLASVRPKA